MIMAAELEAGYGVQDAPATAGVELLRSANESFQRFFEHFAGLPVQGTAEEVTAMRQVEQTLQSVGRLLNKDVQASPDPRLRSEILRYRDNLLRLRQELSAMESSAASCRSRLSNREQHLDAAKAWCAATRTTR
jgi:hypothetical protein